MRRALCFGSRGQYQSSEPTQYGFFSIPHSKYLFNYKLACLRRTWNVLFRTWQIYLFFQHHWWLLQFWWWRRPNQIVILVKHQKGEWEKTFSQNCSSHYGPICRTARGQQRLRPGSGNLGRRMRAEMQNNGWDSVTGDHGGGEEVRKGKKPFIYFFSGF